MGHVSDEFAQRAGTFELDLKVRHHFLGESDEKTDLYAKRMEIPMGAEVGTHAHPFDHMSVLVKGRVTVHTDYDVCYHVAPAFIVIQKNIHHKIVAIEDSVWYCVHATEVNDPDRVDDALLRREG